MHPSFKLFVRLYIYFGYIFTSGTPIIYQKSDNNDIAPLYLHLASEVLANDNRTEISAWSDNDDSISLYLHFEVGGNDDYLVE